jgi:hypothetical protein
MPDPSFMRIRDTLVNIRRLCFYVRLWGLYLTLFKVIGRLPIAPKIFLPLFRQHILVIGCGQFAFSTLGPRLIRFRFFSPIAFAYDPSSSALQSFCNAYAAKALDPLTIKHSLPSSVRLVYICSDHASHFGYLKSILQQGVDAYCEKPVTTSPEQVYELAHILPHTTARFFTGYNRPHSPYIRRIRSCFNALTPDNLFLTFTIYGHFLDSGHWYRHKGQGSRIYGNVAHWIDLVVHILFWRPNLPSKLDISIVYLDHHAYDENLVVRISDGLSFSSQISFFCLLEPFTGVYEHLQIASNKFTARIDNFTRLEIDTSSSLMSCRTRHKSAGHQQAIRQPLRLEVRPSIEILLSELILGDLHSMILARSTTTVFPFQSHFSKLSALLNP